MTASIHSDRKFVSINLA